MMYELVIIWDTGERDIYTYVSEDAAERTAYNMRMVFGKQIAWTGVRPKREEVST